MTAPGAILAAVIAARFLAPLLIPKYPLPGVLACLILDGLDQGVVQGVLGPGFTGYQPYDKALDVYSLSVILLAVFRNWDNRPAIALARALFYFRMAGVLAFELTGWRPLLLVFPNTFEYFFLFCEIVRAWWSPVRLGIRSLVLAVAVIWLAIKIPQEYLLHIARLDVSDLIKARILHAPLTATWAEAVAQGICLAIAALGIALIGRVVPALAPPPNHPFRLSADPLPRSIDEPREWEGYVASRWRVLDRHLVEKVILVGGLTVIFAQIVPGLKASPAVLVGGVAVVAVVNSALLLGWTRQGRPVLAPWLWFLLLAATNTAFVLGAGLILRWRPGGLSLSGTMFSLLLLSLIVTLYDRWHPVFDQRFEPPGEAVALPEQET